MAQPGGSNGPLRVAVIGAGPAGIYATGALLAAPEPVNVDVFEALPVPFGLVRYGVAPDHPKIKSVSAVLAEILGSPQARFLGNVSYGTDLTADDIARHYHAVIHATGSANERSLGVPGEQLAGSFAAADFVAWYNGHPSARAQAFLAAREAVVVGAGNVALDVARMLVTGAEALAATDIPDHVLEAWRSTAVTDVHLLARRGPAYAKFTTPELREMADLEGVDLVVDAADLELDAASELVVGMNRVARRNVDVLRGWADRQPSGAPRRVHFRFWTRPVEILGSDHVEGVAVERTAIDADGALVGSGRQERLPAQAVFRAVGYAGRSLQGLPFDDVSAVVPSVEGRVTGADRAGTYVTGWIKRGPTGVIGTNKSDAAQTVRSLLADAPRLPRPPEPDPDAVTALLDSRGVRYLDWDQWLLLDAYETAEGARRGRPRLKVCSVEDMLAIAHQGEDEAASTG
ncbi:MAG TPA: FAD-dependent oxidoreductase [Jiangellaceae bacterium]